MADMLSPIVDTLKFFSRPIWSYLKKQYQFNADLTDFYDRKQKLRYEYEWVRDRLGCELQTGTKITRSDVEKWLSAAAQEIYRQSVRDEVSQSGCLSSRFRRTTILQRRNADLTKIYDQGKEYRFMNSLVEDHYTRILENKVKIYEELKKKLRGKLQDVKGTLSSQLRFRKIEKEQVKIWLQQVEEMIGPAAEDVEDQVRRGDPSQHAFLATLVKEEILKMEKVYNEGGHLPDSFVVDDPLTLALELPTSELRGSGDVMAKILECLMRDDVTKLGVWGMGGVGKTTIMEHVHNQLLKESKFKKVIWVTVSQTFDVHQIQEQIANSLNGILSKHQNKVVRAATLSKMLESYKPYVLIMDDLWTSFELKDIGIPEPLDCKLVLTTRLKRVILSMDCEPIEVSTLSSEASLVLFLDNVGDVDLSDVACIEGTLKQIVDECGGLPLAIKTIARSMKGISDPRVWSAALNQLRDGRRNVTGKEDDEFLVLKFSYDWLRNEKIQNCFLHCAMYPEDCKIPKEELIEYWIDEELIDVMETRQAKKDEGHSILKKLHENCLLEFIEDRNKVSCVRMHDLVRDMAIQITRSSHSRFLVKAGIGLKELPEEQWKENLSKVSLMHNKIEEIPSSMPSLKCPMLTTLLLSRNSFSTIPVHFFENMPELKILDLSYNDKLCNLPSSISNLRKLTTLLLRHCCSLKKVPSLSNLGRLEKLDLSGTSLEELPGGLEMLMNLKYLTVSNVLQLETTDREISLTEILPNLTKIQHLGVDYGTPVKGEALDRLSKMEVFCGRFLQGHDMSSFFRSRRESLHQYLVYVGALNQESSDQDVVKFIHYCNIDVSGASNFLPSDVQGLSLDSCNDVRSLNDVTGFQDVTGLRKCRIKKCKGLRYVFPRLNRLTKALEELNLEHLDDLKDLFGIEPSPYGTFSSLKQITITHCRKLKKLLPNVSSLGNLEAMEAGMCEQLEQIIVVSSTERKEIATVILPKLVRLKLFGLPMLMYIWSANDVLLYDSLKELTVADCPNLKMGCLFSSHFNPLKTLEILKLKGIRHLKYVFDDEEGTSLAFWKPQPTTTSFPLEQIEVENCPRLKKLFSSALMLGYFQNITCIKVEKCDSLEEIISSTPEEGSSNVNLPLLAYLYLSNLPKLKRLCSSSCRLVGDSLRYLSFLGCQDLKRIPLLLFESGNGELSLPPYLQEIEVSNKRWWESLEWDQPFAKNVLLPFCVFLDKDTDIQKGKAKKFEEGTSSNF